MRLEPTAFLGGSATRSVNFLSAVLAGENFWQYVQLSRLHHTQSD